MSRAAFDQYREALRRGHLAVVAGQLEEAVGAYRDAARLVPDRALPHASMATALHRLGRWPEAEDAFAIAIRLAPEDESVYRARAGALEAVGRPADAALDLDRASQLLEAAGRREEALAIARRSAQLAGSVARAEAVSRIEAAIAAAAGPVGEGVPGQATIDAAPEPPPPPPDPEVLLAEALTLMETGDVNGARDRMLESLAVHRAAGRLDAALDIGLQLLSLAPGDSRVHLAIAALQLDRGWSEVAREKLDLLVRLAALTGDAQAAADAAALATQRLKAHGAATARS